jgi:hypothetical protein
MSIGSPLHVQIGAPVPEQGAVSSLFQCKSLEEYADKVVLISNCVKGYKYIYVTYVNKL